MGRSRRYAEAPVPKGKIVEMWVVHGSLGLMQQLGVVPA
jgi:hypothetical protein